VVKIRQELQTLYMKTYMHFSVDLEHTYTDESKKFYTQKLTMHMLCLIHFIWFITWTN